MDPEIHFQVQLDDAVFGKSWNDIPDLDAGRIPFPISMRGRYAIWGTQDGCCSVPGLCTLR